MIEISEDLKTGILTLKVNASDPNLATEINKVIIEELDAHQRRYNKSKTSDAKQFIEARIIDTEKELVIAEENLKVFRDRNRRIENSPALQLEQQRLSREVTVLIGVFTTLKQQLETTKIEEVKDSDYVIVFDPPEVPLRRSKPNKRQNVIIAGLLGIFFGIVIGIVKDKFDNIDNDDKRNYNNARDLLFKNILYFIPKRFQ